MKTLTADDSKRVRIPDAKPREVFAYTYNEDGTITLRRLTPVPETRPRSRNKKHWAGSKRSLGDHLQALADAGLEIEVAENAKEPVPPCRI